MIVINTERIPIKFWGTQEDWDRQGEAFERQAKNIANHPLARKWIAICADGHAGYGMPIGGVLATEGGVLPNAVGVDIGCGMRAAKLDIKIDQLSPVKLQQWRHLAAAKIPYENHGKLTHELTVSEPETGSIVANNWSQAVLQLGTLGSGNHFIELQRDEEDFVWLMVHSGSRGIGNRVGTFYHRQALELNKMFLSPLPDPALAFIPVGVPLFDMYMAEMRWSMKYSELNRQHIASEAYNAFCTAADWPVSILESYETHHNYVQIENHFGHNYFIHRKGAVRAFGTVIIPGSMGTASYIAKGLHASQSFHSCSHGAGRVMSRTQANKTITAKEAHIAMQNVVYDIREGQYDEMPMAYKDIDAVITAQTALVEPLHRLTPLAVLKG